MEPRELLHRVTGGATTNVPFVDMQRLVEAFGFELLRVRGSHHIYGRSGVVELVSLQEVGGKPSLTRSVSCSGWLLGTI